MLGKGQTKRDSEIGSMCTERDILMGKKNTVRRNTEEKYCVLYSWSPIASALNCWKLIFIPTEKSIIKILEV